MMPDADKVQLLADTAAAIESLFDAIMETRLRIHKIMAAAMIEDLQKIQRLCSEILQLTEWEKPD